MEIQIFLQLILNGIMIGATYGLIVSGLTLVFSIMRIINFAHGELYMLGGFITYYLFAVAKVPYAVTLFVAALSLGLLGLILERLIFRPFRGHLLGAFIVSLGLSRFLQNFAQQAFGLTEKSIPSTFTGKFVVGSVFFPAERMAIVLISIAILICLHMFLQRLKVGQAMRAVAQDSEAALLGGIRINHISGLALALGSGLAGLAGGLLGPVFYVDPWMGGPVILKAFVIIIVGGMGSIPGAILAAFIFGFIESFGGFYFGPAVVTTIFFGALILILLVRPKGLLGYEES